MRILSGICSIAIVLSACAAQVGEDGPYSIQLVRKLLQSPLPQATGFGEKQVNRLGDRVSMALIKILNEEDLSNPQEIRKILPLIRAAFAAPQIITVPEDEKTGGYAASSQLPGGRCARRDSKEGDSRS